MKTPIITIQELLPRPFEMEGLPEFDIKEGHIITFGDTGIIMLQSFIKLADSLKKDDPLIVFWGLSGGLGGFYSTVEDRSLNVESIVVLLRMVTLTQAYAVHSQSNFELLVEKLGGIKTLTKIPFEQALLVLKGKKPAPQMRFEEAEEAEFNDDCNTTCKPGYHTCGK